MTNGANPSTTSGTNASNHIRRAATRAVLATVRDNPGNYRWTYSEVLSEIVEPMLAATVPLVAVEIMREIREEWIEADDRAQVETDRAPDTLRAASWRGEARGLKKAVDLVRRHTGLG